ncbi:NAD dependent epimerase/dehydratase family protein [Lutispora thermophila DSM 19022]|uniref:UDP-glucose 4-epimerase n=1 Tax=Lutispora thermophila DSM 19022 TaxID=1122184 RepID=A0A1M6BYW6_9FIRM|nr:NAD dependent epimerase/dehydratase family protein [Lutispora thermophila DSM 19022]
MKKVLVTGGAGFIGSHVVDRVIEEGHEVVILDNLSTGKVQNINVHARFYIADIRDKDIGDIFKIEKPDIVIHHAAQIDVQRSIKEPAFDGDINIIGTVNMLENCRKFGVDKFIYASSAAIYGTPVYLPVDEKHSIEPISYYGVSKYTPELYIKVYN